ncbi:MaoC family dehydratase [Amaricoccus macauensis]|uniref:MaoC family dehydratase n=1 Tax=Amaricoccus macauensis TaxID=57001 RepID=UPI003C7B1646
MEQVSAGQGTPVALGLEDFAVGQIYESGTLTVDAADIKGFAARFDPQPFHLDEIAARGSFFGGLAASGWHTAALTMRLLVTGGLPIKGGMIGAGVELAWSRPVRPGDTLRVVSEVIEVRPSRSKPDRGFVTVQSRTLNQKDEAVQEMTSRVMVFRRG